MSKIHYFQRYSSMENTVTNNTLQLFARIYEYSSSVASSVLSDIIGETVEIGIGIQQQTHGGESVPDGEIVQNSFKILIEAKIDTDPYADQLVKHAKLFKNESKKLLLLLTKQPVGNAKMKEFLQRIHHEVSPEIILKNITYEEICGKIEDLFKEHEATMLALVQDYIEYCNDTKLFDQSKFLMRIVPCGQSININKKHGIYFQRNDRGYTPHAFVGIYAEKNVRFIMETESVFDVTFQDDGTLSKIHVEGTQTDKYDKSLIDIIKDAEIECGYKVATGHRFFCGQLFETEFKKTSPGGIYGARFVNLREIIGDFSDASEVATKLRAAHWE